MSNTLTLPLWLAAPVVLLAAWALVDRLLLPSARWFLRRRVDRVIDEVNTRLHIHLQPFKLTKRQVLINRLLYDSRIMEAAAQHAQEHGMPRAVVMQKVERYAREIVPAFNAYVYFRLGYWLARRLARALYRVRVGYADDAGLASVQPDSTVVFIINHRSNMDYILVAYLAAERAALSYAVGEWARIWPLRMLIRSMGAYFVRRRSRDPLYRRVLERYVQMATDEGVTQAIFLEGGLSRDGKLQPPKLGLLDYMLRSFDPDSPRDVVFIPVALNYDRTLEDRSLLLDLDPEGDKRGRVGAVLTTLRFVLHNLLLAARRRWYRFGYACVNFGTPVSVKAYLAGRRLDLRQLPRQERFARIDELARQLMAGVGEILPVVPVPLVATVFLRQPGRSFSELELKAEVQSLIQELEGCGAHVYVPRADRDYAIDVGLRTLTLRHLVVEEAGLYIANPRELPLLRYYASSIGHLVPSSLPVASHES